MSPLRIATTPLAAPTPGSDPKLTATAQRFEAIFVRQMLAAARKTDFGGGDVVGGQGMDTFRQMQDERFADIASERGAFGIAKVLEAQLAHVLPLPQPDGKK
jgi:flagellar protein FlgJ